MTLRSDRVPRAWAGRRRLCPASRDRDAGNAIVEFVYLAVLLMVPLVYVLLTVFRVQSAAFAVSSAAREAGRVYATSDSVDDAGPRADAAAGIVMADSGLSLSTGDLRITCSTSRCLEPGSQVQVMVTYRVTLPLVPRFFADRAPASIRVTSHHLEVVDRYRAPAR
jgi:Flp pilus assembly protein TadG